MEKRQFKIKQIHEKREGENERGKWAYQDMHLIEDNEASRFPEEFLVTFGITDTETIAKLKAGDTVKCGMTNGVHSFTSQSTGKEYKNNVIAGWQLEVVQLSAL